MTFERNQQKLLSKIPSLGSRSIGHRQWWLEMGLAAEGNSTLGRDTTALNTGHWQPPHWCWRASAVMHLLVVSAGNTRWQAEVLEQESGVRVRAWDKTLLAQGHYWPGALFTMGQEATSMWTSRGEAAAEQEEIITWGEDYIFTPRQKRLEHAL